MILKSNLIFKYIIKILCYYNILLVKVSYKYRKILIQSYCFFRTIYWEYAIKTILKLF